MTMFRMVANGRNGPDGDCGYCGERGLVWAVATLSDPENPEHDGEANVCQVCNQLELSVLRNRFVIQRPITETWRLLPKVSRNFRH